ncbi:hypothetical protein [Stakelama saccharophila]|uniref:Uncharacterized protein n=1 Tax=Stakelama saccharophila TaxID=3075605 RepID=A0ABZ0B773_9SPHN|nr:hypothetical protein [Stakelama sp. W311]WNO53072.1 hypothetical protein RPR59_11500 [Stakelama sp. W311]
MRPISIRRFELFYLLAVALGILNGILSWNTTMAAMEQQSPEAAAIMPAATAVGLAIGLGISLLLWFFVARRASNVARWILIVLYALGLLSFLYTLSMGTMAGGGVSMALMLLSYVLEAIAIYMTFRPDADAWLKGQGPAEEQARPFE